jgi:hypothetical protein
VRNYVEAGGLASYGASFTDAARSSRHLHRSNPEGYEARGFAGRASYSTLILRSPNTLSHCRSNRTHFVSTSAGVANKQRGKKGSQLPR